MRLERPTPEITAAVDSAARWLRTEKVKAPEEVFLRHTADFDTVVVQDPKAKPIWARHYEIGQQIPLGRKVLSPNKLFVQYFAIDACVHSPSA